MNNAIKKRTECFPPLYNTQIISFFLKKKKLIIICLCFCLLFFLLICLFVYFKKKKNSSAITMIDPAKAPPNKIDLWRDDVVFI